MTAVRSARYLAAVGNMRVAPQPKNVARLEELGGALPQSPTDPTEVLALLDDVGSPATVATTGGRYFGFVIGGTLPAALAANWLAGVWDQNAGFSVLSPVAAKIEEIVSAWIIDLLGLPRASGAGFVTGTTMANFSALAAARTALLQRSGWNIEEDGIFGAPPIRVVVGQEVHVSLLKALALLGLGRSRVISVPTDSQGRMRAEALPELDSRTLICIQAGNVNSGAFDPADKICSRAREAGAWVHVDGAFGLWRRSPRSTRVYCTASPSPIPGQLTATSGLTCPTTQELLWFATLITYGERWPRVRLIFKPAMCVSLVITLRNRQGAPEELNCGPPCAHWDGKD